MGQNNARNGRYPVEEHHVILARQAPELESSLSSDKLQQEHAIAKHISLLRGLASGEILRGNVPDGAANCRGDMRVSVVQQFGQSEVAHYCFEIFVE